MREYFEKAFVSVVQISDVWTNEIMQVSSYFSICTLRICNMEIHQVLVLSDSVLLRNFIASRGEVTIWDFLSIAFVEKLQRL
jgi:hypothetical protein